MARAKHKSVKFSAKEMADDLPDELDFNKLRFIGRGKDAIFRRSPAEKTVTLDADVAKVFADSKSVNNALRVVIELIEVGQKAIKKVKKMPRRMAS